MIDVALGIEAVVPNAQYFGSTTANTKECFDNLNWQDARPKPTWKEVQDGYAQAEADAQAKATAKAALLDRLGITAEEAQLLLS